MGERRGSVSSAKLANPKKWRIYKKQQKNYDFNRLQATTTTTTTTTKRAGLFFRLFAEREEPLDTGGGRVFSLDASFGLLATRWRLWRRGDSWALRSACGVSSMIWRIKKKIEDPAGRGTSG